MSERSLEDVIVLAENSESSDAIMLAAEVRRLQKIEAGLTGHIERHTTLAQTLMGISLTTRSDGNHGAANKLERDAADIMYRVRRLKKLLD